MASVYFGLNYGDDQNNVGKVTTGAASGSTDVEVRIDTGKLTNVKDALVILEALESYIASGFNTSLVTV